MRARFTQYIALILIYDLIISKYATVKTPASFTNSAPIPPPSSEPKQSEQVCNILKQLRLYGAGKSAAPPWSVFYFDPPGFQELPVIIGADESLWSFFEYNIQY
jgi:hypothetical protein